MSTSENDTTAGGDNGAWKKHAAALAAVLEAEGVVPDPPAGNTHSPAFPGTCSPRTC